MLNEIYNTLKKSYNGNKTIENINKMKKIYPELFYSFEEWLSRYWNIERSKIFKNDVLFNIENESDYYKSIIYYISGMTDNFAIDIYNKIIGF